MVSSMPNDITMPTEEVDVVAVDSRDKNRKMKSKRKRRYRRRLVKFYMDEYGAPLCTEYTYPGALYNANYDDLFWGDEEMDNLQEETALFIEEIRNRGETAYTEALEGLIVSELEDPENLNMSKTVTKSPTRGFETYFSPIILKLQKACVDEVLEAQRKMKYVQTSSERKEREKVLAKVSKKWSHELRMFAHKKALGDFMQAMKIHKENNEEKKRESRDSRGRGRVRPSKEQPPKESQHSAESGEGYSHKSERAFFAPPKPPSTGKSPRTPSSARKSPRSERKSSLRDYSKNTSQSNVSISSNSTRKLTRESSSRELSRGIVKESGHSKESTTSTTRGSRNRKPVPIY